MVTREEYLKRYLSGADYEERPKKRKKKPKAGTITQSRIHIYDDDITVRDVAPEAKEGAETDLYEEDGPTVAGQTDDRPEEVQQLEVFRDSCQWKTLGGKATDSVQDRLGTSDKSPVRESRYDSDSDESPVRKPRHDSHSDQSPVRTQEQDFDSDQSPLRKHTRGSNSDQSPPRKHKGSDSDQSPPRKHKGSDSDQSPPRKKSSQKQFPEDMLRGSKRQRPSRFEPQVVTEKDDRGRAKKTLSGLTAGLSTARAMRMENDVKRKREQDMFDQADETTLGIGAKTVFRDKTTGKRRNLVKEGEAEAKENAIKEALLAKYKAWGKGLVQSKDQSERLAEALHEADKPLARSRGDDDLENLLRGQERAEDPMLAYIQNKKRKAVTKGKELPRYKGSQPPANRFNLWPGYRWDGIDRSNGFEKSLFAKRSERKAVAEDAYKWSIEDM